MDIATTRMSSKGQIVIPSELREGIQEGEKFIIIIQEDLKFAKRTEEAWKSYERGEFESKSVDDFLSDLEKC